LGDASSIQKKQLLDADEVIGGKYVINAEYRKLAGAF
jgi:hypothetical protein